MSIDSSKDRLEPCSRVAERMRLYRKRRRLGLRSVRILLRVTTIDDFVRAGLLDRQHRDNPQALQAVVTRVLRQAVKKLRNQHPLLVTTSRAVR